MACKEHYEYAAVLTVVRKDGVILVRIAVFDAWSEDDALGKTYKAAEEQYPRGDGWHDHRASVISTKRYGDDGKEVVSI